MSALYESPSMCWYRTNRQLAEKNGTKLHPAKSDYSRWLRGCQQNPKRAREVYLAFREELNLYDEECRAQFHVMVSMDKLEPTLVEVFGDLF